MNFKKILSATLATTLCLSMAACGDKTTTVDDYGMDEESTTTTNDNAINDSNDSSTPTATASDGLYIATGATGTLQEVLGSSVSYKNEFKIGEANFSGSLQVNIPDQDGLNIYNVEVHNNLESKEADIVKALFGDTAEKIESISYTNEYDYITLLYKCHFIQNKHQIQEDMMNGSKRIFTLEDDTTIINSSFSEEYKWIDKNVEDDEEEYFIHMYEGDYKNTRYVLLLAYDSLIDTSYIFFDPKSIKDYYPDYDFKTLMVSGNTNLAGEPLDIDNLCTDDIETLKSDAQDLLDNILMFDGQYTVTENAYSYNMNNENYDVWLANPEMLTDNPSDYENFSSVLMFSNTDYISTYKAGVPGVSIDCINVAEQKDLFSDYNQTQQTEKNFGFFINSEAVEEMVEETTYVTDGYAFYIDSFNDYEEDPYAITMYDQNKGIIKYTSKGLYGFDIAISQNITDVIENVKLQDFEHIKKSFDTAIKEQLELSKLNNPTNIQLRSISLDYDMYFPNGELTNITYYPAWDFVLGNTTDTDYTAHVTINAMDGSVVDIMYYDYGE